MVGRIADRFSSALWIVAVGTSAWLGTTAAYAATIEVTHLVDDTSPANGTCTLREAIRAANGNVAVDACPAGQSGVRDTILVRPGVHQVSLVSGAAEDLAVTGDLDVRGSVWVRGASSRHSIIEGSAAGAVDRLFEIHDVAEDVVLEGVSLRGGHPTTAARDGGVLRNLETGANGLELREVEIAGGLAESGGGISNAGNLKILRSRILGNQTELSPGAAGNRGGGIVSDGPLALLRIEDSEIRDNQAEEDGGGVWVGSAPFVIHRSAITGNVAGDAGGGLHAGPGSDGFDVQYVELARNRATDGGGMYMGSSGEVQRSAFVANEATLHGGGLIDVAGGFARFSTFAQNVAQEGGGIWANAPQTLLDSNTLAENQGGGVYNQNGVFLENDLLADNTGGNCTGNPPNFGAFNLEKGSSCGLGPTPTGPNFPDTDPVLGPLAHNGGPTPTMALLPGSPAIDVVTSEIRTNCQNMRDQRGYPRGRPRFVNGSNEDVYLCDIGAFERTLPFVVDSLADAVDADPADDVCAAAGGGCTLRAAVQQANAIPGMNEIVLGAGVHLLALGGTGESAAATGDLDLVPPVFVRGAGVGITGVDGAGLDRVFEIGAPPPDLSPAPATSFIRDLTISGGDAGTANGGGLAVRSPLRIDRVRLTANDGNRGSAMSSAPTGFSFGADRPLVEIVDSTIDGNAGGGALYLADAVIERSSLIDNLADGGLNGGGGEFLKVSLENSTVSGNYSAATGAFFANSALIENSTIYDNTADAGFDPGGVFLLELSVFRNSIIANNRAGGVVQNCAANPNGITSLGHNLTDGNGIDCMLTAATDRVAQDPLLGALANNGGPTLTHLLLGGSSAIDGGDPAVCPSTDQRSTPRPRDGDGNGSSICDIGAVEVPEPALTAQLLAGGFALALAARGRRSLRPRIASAKARSSRRAGADVMTDPIDVPRAAPISANAFVMPRRWTRRAAAFLLCVIPFAPGGFAAAQGAVVGWGYGDYGQLAVPDLVNGVSGTASAISAAGNHGCAIHSGSGAVTCWGWNHLDQATPPAAVDGTSGSASAISVGVGHGCAIQSGSDAIVCWGSNSHGQSNVRAEKAAVVSAGNILSCAVEAGTGRAFCWGLNTEGQADPPASVDGSSGTATTVSAGFTFACAIQAGTSAVVCWGSNGFGQRVPPDAVNGTTGTATSLSAGNFHGCAIQSGTGAVVCWGDDTYGQSSPPDAVNGTAGSATQISSGAAHSCAIQSGTGSVVCWGNDLYGESVPPLVVDGTFGSASAIAAGGNHAFAIAVPEPGFALSLACAAAWLGLRGRRRGSRPGPRRGGCLD